MEIVIILCIMLLMLATCYEVSFFIIGDLKDKWFKAYFDKGVVQIISGIGLAVSLPILINWAYLFLGLIPIINGIITLRLSKKPIIINKIKNYVGLSNIVLQVALIILIIILTDLT